MNRKHIAISVGRAIHAYQKLLVPLYEPKSDSSTNIPISSPQLSQKIDELIRDDEDFVQLAALILFENQTSDEQHAGKTRWKNGVGLSASDAALFTRVGEFVASGQHITEAQVAALRRPYRNTTVVGKYRQQIAQLLFGGAR